MYNRLLYTNHEVTLSFLYNFHKLQKMLGKTLKCHCINLYLALNSELHEVDWFEELSLSTKIVPLETSTLDLLEFIFKTNLSDIYIMLLQHTKYSRALEL